MRELKYTFRENKKKLETSRQVQEIYVGMYVHLCKDYS